MLERAGRERNTLNQYEYSVIRQGHIENKYVGTCDIVIAVNVLHQFADKKEGLRLSNMMLKRGGKLLIIECGQEDAIALITSYVLEAKREPNIYFGDITYCSVKEREGAYENFNAVLEKWDDILLGNIKQKTIAGNHYTCMNVEHAVSLARVIISETGDDNLDDIKSEKEEVHFIVTEDCLEKNHFYIEYALYKRKESILCAMLRFLMDRGIFVNENQVYTFKEIKERITLCQKMKRY